MIDMCKDEQEIHCGSWRWPSLFYSNISRRRWCEVKRALRVMQTVMIWMQQKLWKHVPTKKWHASFLSFYSWIRCVVIHDVGRLSRWFADNTNSRVWQVPRSPQIVNEKLSFVLSSMQPCCTCTDSRSRRSYDCWQWRLSLLLLWICVLWADVKNNRCCFGHHCEWQASYIDGWW